MDTKQPMQTSNSRKRRCLLAVAALIILGASVLPGFLSSSKDQRYLTAQAEVADLEEAVLASGTLEASKQVSVGAQASGQVKSLKVGLGDQVKKGQLIAEIDALTQQNALRTAEAALSAVKAQRRSKQAEMRKAELAFSRQREMRAHDASPQQDMESAEAALLADQADIQSIEAQIEQARIGVDTARVNLGYTRITAPMDGVVVAIVTKEGQTVNAVQQAPTIIKLARLDTMTVKAQISEADVPRVRPGQSVHFTILGEPDHPYHATLRAVEPAPDSINSDTTTAASSTTTGSSSGSSSSAIYYNGLFDAPNPDGKLRISMTAQVTIVLAEAKGALVIPVAALGGKDGQGRCAVRVLDGSGRPIERRIGIGLTDHIKAQVLCGLKPGDQVILGEATARKSGDDPLARRPGPPPMGL